MAEVIRLVARRRRAIEQLDIAAGHASVPNWEHDQARRDAIAFRLLLVARLARDGERPSDISPDDWAWAQRLERFGGIVEPSRNEPDDLGHGDQSRSRVLSAALTRSSRPAPTAGSWRASRDASRASPTE